MNVPVLRFPEFSGEWEVKKIGEVANVYDGTHQTPEYVENGVKFVSVENINNLDNTKKFITKEAFYKEYKIKPRIGDILMTRITAGIIGATAIINSNEPLGYYVSLALLRIKNDFDVSFLSQRINSYEFKSELHKRIIHVAFPKKINLGDISECKASFPSLTEQQKIADFLTQIDKKINQLSQKKQLLERYKKGVMQQIFSQSIRFTGDDGREFPEWEDRKLAELVEKIGSGGTPKSTNAEYYNGNIPWVSIADMTSSGKIIVNTKRKITTLGLQESSARLYPSGVVLFAMYASIGEVAIAKIPVTTSQAILGIEPKNELLLNEYLYFWLFSLKDKISLMGQKGTQSNLNLEIVKNFLIAMPSLPEQTKIANFLTALDNKIALVESQLNGTKQYKKGLLQQLFI